MSLPTNTAMFHRNDRHSARTLGCQQQFEGSSATSVRRIIISPDTTDQMARLAGEFVYMNGVVRLNN